MPNWNFDNSYHRLSSSLFAKLAPVAVKDPSLALFNTALARELGLDSENLTQPENAGIFSGNILPVGAEPIAQAYAGHQFGHFTMLGDGRAILLGEHIDPKGNRFDVQLKGSGQTPFSRRGDGRAVLGPMIREFIVSEAMHRLGIPSTRSLAVATTGELVQRESLLPGAVLTRIASSHIRVGTFEYVSEYGTPEVLKQLADYTIQRHYPEIEGEKEKYLLWFDQITKRQARLIAQWMLVGFIHGVMNTDNMALSGQTIDYGPCAFIDKFNPQAVFSGIDTGGRYAYDQQPTIAQWNLARLAESILDLISSDKHSAAKLAQEKILEFSGEFNSAWLSGMRAKLGLVNTAQEDLELVQNLLLLIKDKYDFTNTFWALSQKEIGKLDRELLNIPDFFAADAGAWYSSWEKRTEKEEALRLMQQVNPWIIPRNHQLEKVIQAAEQNNDLGPAKQLFDAITNPFSFDPKLAHYQTTPTPDEAVCRTHCGT